MMKAVDAVVKDKLSVRRAAVEYNVPRSTLGDRISGRILPGAVSGKSKYLSNEEEEELVTISVFVDDKMPILVMNTDEAKYERGMNDVCRVP